MKTTQSGIFRSVDFWKSAVMTMPDNSFFELMRSVFGKIKTPFNKQQLLKDLEKFLLREDIQKTIAAYIDENDAKVISAVALFGEPAPGELESFFAGELNIMQLQDIIVNLEERFIIFRSKNRLALNPVLEKVLTPFTEDTSVLFPSVTEAEADLKNKNGKIITQTVINELTLACILSFVSQWQTVYKAEGILRKQIIEAGKTVFPGINMEEMFGSLQVLGLLYADGEKLLIDTRHLQDFVLLTARERIEYCAAAMLTYKEIKPQTEILSPLYKSRIREMACLIHSLLDSLSEDCLYPDKTIIRLAEVLKTKTGIHLKTEQLFDVLKKTALIAAVSHQYNKLGDVTRSKKSKNSKQYITIDSGSSILVYPEIDFADAVSLASFLNIKETGAVVRFELEKDSAVRAFDNGITAQEIIDTLTRLFGKKINETLAWNIKDWEKRYKEVSLKKGLVLTLSREHSYLAQTEPLAEIIEETLAPGVYLLNEKAEEDAADVLHNAGIDIIARRQKKDNTLKRNSNFDCFPRFFQEKSNIINFKIEKEKINKKRNQIKSITDPKILNNQFHLILSKMKIDKTERDELSARIDRRLVLCESQLKDSGLRYEKLEARNMDYAGKQNIAKQAIAQKSPVEIVWQNGKQIFGIPKTLDKDGNELILIVKHEQEELRIPLAKISLLRRIKKSIFEG